jgi:hypothetical protein
MYEKQEKAQKDNADASTQLTKQIKSLNEELERIQTKTDKNALASVKPQKVNDAIIVEPHTKDQVLMAKKDGPVDLMMRDMVSKFDQMMGIMAQGLGIVANTTSESGNQIVQAVLASGGSKSSGGNSDAFAGSDPIRDLRDRALRGFNL